MSEGILPRDITPEQLKAAYALNLCTVSVSQIVDYKDVCILEQEYNAILNNLNLEVIPKDDALLRTLTEILNTITFFRIQEIRKEQLDKEYQRRLKNAIWSAIPSLNVVVSNNPAVMALSLAAQVGTAYMSYRREKANAKADHEAVPRPSWKSPPLSSSTPCGGSCSPRRGGWPMPTIFPTGCA